MGNFVWKISEESILKPNSYTSRYIPYINWYYIDIFSFGFLKSFVCLKIIILSCFFNIETDTTSGLICQAIQFNLAKTPPKSLNYFDVKDSGFSSFFFYLTNHYSVQISSICFDLIFQILVDIGLILDIKKSLLLLE